jgi:hypothetical protein
MGDSWEDEDFEIPILPSASQPIVASHQDEEEDLTQIDAAKLAAQSVKPSAAAVLQKEKKEKEQIQAFENKLKLSAEVDETSEQRKIRERKQVEEADNELTGELFQGKQGTEKINTVGASSLSNIASISLKTKQDHTNFGAVTSQRLAESSAFNISAFYKSLSKTLTKPSVTLEVLDEIIADIQSIRDSKAKEVKKATSKAAVPKKSKKEIQQEEQKHSSVFGGGSYGVDKYDHLNSLEDDFM